MGAYEFPVTNNMTFSVTLNGKRGRYYLRRPSYTFLRVKKKGNRVVDESNLKVPPVYRIFSVSLLPHYN